MQLEVLRFFNVRGENSGQDSGPQERKALAFRLCSRHVRLSYWSLHLICLATPICLPRYLLAISPVSTYSVAFLKVCTPEAEIQTSSFHQRTKVPQSVGSGAAAA